MAALYMIGCPILAIRGNDVGIVADDEHCHYVDSGGISNALGGDGRIAMLVRIAAKSRPPASARDWLRLATYNLTYFGWGSIHQAADLHAAVDAVREELLRREAAVRS